MNLENTPLYNSQFPEPVPDVAGKDSSPYERALRRQAQINVIANHLMQQVIAETPYKPDMQWQMWHAVRVAEDTNALPYGVTAEDVYNHYLSQYEAE